MALISKDELSAHRPRITAAEMELVINTHIRDALQFGKKEVAISTRRLAFQTDMAMSMIRSAGYAPKLSNPAYSIAPEGQTIHFPLE